ncbi:MAG: serine/threonine protein kinase [Deltaproteobacteria bacterium]|nr:serine/threonine protein kinase [Deltaproteobacteria bacterium]
MVASSPDAPTPSDDDDSQVRSADGFAEPDSHPESGRMSVDRMSRGVSMPPPIASIGRYDVLGRIAIGGMAEIYLAQERSSGGSSRLVVLKILRTEIDDEADLDALFLREGSVAMQLSHPNICSTYEFGKVGGHYFIAMEFVDGANIRQMLTALAKRRQAMPVSYAVAIFARVAAALDYAHSAKDSRRRRMGVVHRDVTPHNVMVRGDGVVKLLDFGVVQVAGDRDAPGNEVKGKHGYLSPEQVLGKPLDGRSDVFALGICLYEVLTMKRLYKRDGQRATFKAILQDPVPSIRDVDDSLPEAIDAIVQRALAKHPEQRFQTAGDMQQALEEWLAEERQVVNASRLGELMRTLYGEQLEEGPDLVSDDTVSERLALFEEVREEDVVAPRTAPPPAPDPAIISAPVPTVAPPPQPKPRRPMALLVVGGLVIAALGIGAGIALRDSGSPPAAETTAPTRESVDEVDPALEEEAEPAGAEMGSTETETTEAAASTDETVEDVRTETDPETDTEATEGEDEPEVRRGSRRRRRARRPRFVDDPGF